MMRAFGPLIGRGPPEPSTRGQIFRTNKPADPRVPVARHRPQCGAAARCLPPRTARKAPHVMTAAGTGSKQQRVRRLYPRRLRSTNGRSIEAGPRSTPSRSIDRLRQSARVHYEPIQAHRPPLKSLQLMSSQDLRWGGARLISAGLGVFLQEWAGAIRRRGSTNHAPPSRLLPGAHIKQSKAKPSPTARMNQSLALFLFCGSLCASAYVCWFVLVLVFCQQNSSGTPRRLSPDTYTHHIARLQKHL